MRLWQHHGDDDGSIHPIGNGAMLVYAQCPNITHIYGPPYSAPSFLTMDITDDGDIRVESTREPGTAIWRHAVTRDSEAVGTLTDFMLLDRHVFMREFALTAPLTLTVTPHACAQVQRLPGYFSRYGIGEPVTLLRIPKGINFFMADAIGFETNMLIVLDGDARWECDDGDLRVVLGPGTGRLLCCADPYFGRLMADAEAVLGQPGHPWLAETRAWWQAFTARRHDFAARIPDDHPEKARMLDAIDSVSVLMKAQQSFDGGVMAGHKYNLAYMRDQSGVFRAFLALGYLPEAKAILDFWWHKFQLNGDLWNAEGMGNDAVRLMFTNDEVEIPAYLLCNVFRYYQLTGDNGYLRQVQPMLEWAFEVQLPHLAGGMLEFSGDETYIAGHVYPNYLTDQGSAESTLLFITGGQHFVDWLEWTGTCPPYRLGEYRRHVDAARAAFRENFLDGDTLYANNPRREALADLPRFRLSFCHAHEMLDDALVYTWLERTAQGYYVCPACLDRTLPERDMTRRYVLNSVNLTPLYHGSDLFTREECLALIRPGAEMFEREHAIPSEIGGHQSLGYDYGLMLYNLTMLHHPLRDTALTKVLDILDPTGAWVEFYHHDTPTGCRARPWESGINIEAITAYITSITDSPVQQEHQS